MRVLVALFLLFSGMAHAAPENSLRPLPRQATKVTLEDVGPTGQRPRDDAAKVASSRGLDRSLRPEKRPGKFRGIARQQERLRKRGAVCGDLDIQGEVAGRIKGSKSGCGVNDSVRIRSISGVALSQKALMDCQTAKALKSWVESTAKPVLAGKGGGLKRLRVAAHYACRTRNNRVGARISEHGKGRAIDISGLQLRDGTLITVRNGWKGKDTGPLLRRLHSGACGPFGTVLGPKSDRFHIDHFHFDTARYRSGPYCR